MSVNTQELNGRGVLPVPRSTTSVASSSRLLAEARDSARVTGLIRERGFEQPFDVRHELMLTEMCAIFRKVFDDRSLPQYFPVTKRKQAPVRLRTKLLYRYVDVRRHANRQAFEAKLAALEQRLKTVRGKLPVAKIWRQKSVTLRRCNASGIKFPRHTKTHVDERAVFGLLPAVG
jgi:hypothetical protein